MQKKRRDWLGKEFSLGATGGGNKLGLGIVEENAWGEPQAMDRRDSLRNGALWLDKLLWQRYRDKESELRNMRKTGKTYWEESEGGEMTGMGIVNKLREQGEGGAWGAGVCGWDWNYKLMTEMSQYVADSDRIT